MAISVSALVLTFLLAGGIAGEAKSVEVCDLNQRTVETLADKSVVFHARYFSDGKERAALKDDRCPNVIVEFTFKNAQLERKLTNALHKETGYITTVGRRVEAQFYGRFKKRGVKRPIYVFQVEKISDISVRNEVE